jgi:2,4-dienoyl-CoA reductase-like NADH-dependent reductase (Old Yellow Enzyme family)
VLGRTYAKPHPATEDEIKHIIKGWAHAAEYLHKAGFDGIEIHAAHGYLLSQFLAPGTNHRTDKYGGDLENRSRLIFEIADEIRKRVPPSFLIGVKLNSVEFQDGGFDEEECRKLCEKIEANGFDFVELSGGTYEQVGFRYKRDSMKKREAFFLDFAEAIVPALHRCKPFVTGGFKTVGSMVKALDIVDGVGLGRVLCQEPRFVPEVLAGKIQGAIRQRLDPMNYPLTNVAAGTQIRQMGKNEEPVDLSVEENEVAFRKDMAAWMVKKADDKEGKEVGYVDITSVPGVPYKEMS